MQSPPLTERSWLGPAAIIFVVGLGSLIVLILLGSQVSNVLSTVGSAVGPGPYVGSEGDTSGESEDGGAGPGPYGGPGEDPSGGSGDGGVVTASVRDGALIIKTGEMSLQVASIDAALTDATRQVSTLGGYASGSERSGTGDDAQATITFRVPADQWDAAMDGMRALADVVLSERSATEDVTTQVVDLGARIRNLQATERALQAIMDRATEIKDVLSVQTALTTVRGSIEQLSAEKAHLEEQAAASTLKVTFLAKPTPVLVEQRAGFEPAREVDAASARFVSILQHLVKAGIWFAIVWLPILIVLAIGAVVAFLVIRRVRRFLPAGVTEG
jgi:hypothetical protein